MITPKIVRFMIASFAVIIAISATACAQRAVVAKDPDMLEIRMPAISDLLGYSALRDAIVEQSEFLFPATITSENPDSVSMDTALNHVNIYGGDLSKPKSGVMYYDRPVDTNFHGADWPFVWAFRDALFGESYTFFRRDLEKIIFEKVRTYMARPSNLVGLYDAEKGSIDFWTKSYWSTGKRIYAVRFIQERIIPAFQAAALDPVLIAMGQRHALDEASVHTAYARLYEFEKKKNFVTEHVFWNVQYVSLVESITLSGAVRNDAESCAPWGKKEVVEECNQALGLIPTDPEQDPRLADVRTARDDALKANDAAVESHRVLLSTLVQRNIDPEAFEWAMRRRSEGGQDIVQAWVNILRDAASRIPTEG